MAITITCFASSPDRGRGLARDMPVRWALEEAGLPYRARPLAFDDLAQPSHLAIQPFGQIPTFEEDGLVLFETGAIVLHIAQGHAGLLPIDPHARARTTACIFAALSTMEPPIVEPSMTALFDQDRPWYEDWLRVLDERVRRRVAQLAARLGDAAWLEGDFSAADLLMVQVLRRLGSSRLLEEFATIAAYVARAQSRPAFQRAFAAQLAAFEASQER